MRTPILACLAVGLFLGTTAQGQACISRMYPNNTASSIAFVPCDNVIQTYIHQIQAGIDQWNVCPTAGLGFPSMGIGGGADITINVMRTFGLSTTATGGCGQFHPELDSNGVVVGGTIELFDMDRYGADCVPEWPGTVAHEIGHVLGLGHSDCPNHIMGYVWPREVQSAECEAADAFAALPSEVVEPPPTGPDPLQHTCVSPIILDMDGHGYRLTSLEDGVTFDLRNEGQARQVAWTRADAGNAFLALDINDNGIIDDGGELFGNFTRLRSGGLAANGFEALRELDDDGDGVVDGHDAAWIRLLLWTDLDHDGISSPDELMPIAASAVTALGTDYHAVSRSDRWRNFLQYMSQFRMMRGSTERSRVYYDVFLRIGE
jgi:hypothetical protein